MGSKWLLCNIQAPLITQGSTPESGSSDWTVSRTSLQLRNPTNAAASWVTSVLKGFNERESKGEDPDAIAHSEIRDGQFYFIKAIKGKLAKLYPNDQATVMA